MSTTGLTINSAAGAPLSVSGLASGLNTSSIIAALMSAEREPVTHLTAEQSKLTAEQVQLQSLQSGIQQLGSAVSEFDVPSLFEGSQAATSSEPSRVAAATTGGAGIGGYEVEVTQLANSAQRTFTFSSPRAEQTITIEGREYKLAALGSAQELANAINSDTKGTTYAAVLSSGAIVLSSRATGNTGGEFIKVSDPGGALSEQTGAAKEGKNAEFTVDGVAGTSSSNTVTEAIPGVTLTLNGLTSTGPVTISVQPPGPNVAAIEAQVQAFVKMYNSTVSAIEQQLTAKIPAKPDPNEPAAGALFGDTELTGVLDSMREAMYEPIAGLTGPASPFDIGISTGAPTGGGATSQSALEGQLTIESAKLGEALRSNPVGVKQMLEQWSEKIQGVLTAAGGPGGTMEARINGDAAQITQLSTQISQMNSILAEREKALQATYAKLEGVISKSTAQGDWLTQQEETMLKSEG